MPVISLVPNPDTQQNLLNYAPDFLEDSERVTAASIHITLAYLGEYDDLSHTQEDLIGFVEAWARGMGSLNGSVQGYGAFNHTDDNKAAIWLAYDSPDLPNFRHSLINMLEDNGIDYAQNHGFTPHITLAYTENLEPFTIDLPENLTLNFNQVSIMWRDDLIKLPLDGGMNRRKPEMPSNNDLAIRENGEGFFNRLGKSVYSLFTSEKLNTEAARALSVANAWEQAWELLEEMDQQEGGYRWPMDIFVEDSGGMFLIYTNEGQLYRSPITIMNDTLSLGGSVRVTQAFPAVHQARTVRMVELPNGKKRFVMIAATAMLNRVGEIDSTILFDNFIKRATDSDEWPKIDFWHFNEIEVGHVVPGGLFRDDHVYMCVFEFNETQIGRAAERGFIDTLEYWGASIQFWAIEREIIQAGGVDIPVYVDGINNFVTLLPESGAASWYTSPIQRKVDIMNDKQYDDLLKLLGGDEELAQQAVADADATNRQISDTGAIARSVEETAEEAAETEEVSIEIAAEIEETAEVAAEIEVDFSQPGVIEALASGIVSSDIFQQAVASQLETVTQSLNQNIDALKRNAGIVQQLTKRLTDLERTQEEAAADLLDNLPSSTTIAPTRFVFKDGNGRRNDQPRQQGKSIHPGDIRDIAESTVANMEAAFTR